MNNDGNSVFKRYKELSEKLMRLGSLMIVTYLFRTQVFCKFYFAEIALTREGVIAAIVTVVMLVGLFLISKWQSWPKNVAIKIISDLIYSLLMATTSIVLLTSIGAVLSCGIIKGPLVCTIFGVITIWKTYWTDLQLTEFCVKELSLQKDIKNVKEINIQQIVIKAENSRDKCKLLLKEAIEQEKEKKTYKAWLFWLLGLSRDETTNRIKVGYWTYAVIFFALMELGYAFNK